MCTLIIISAAHAQTVDQCATTPAPGNSANIVIQKLMCRLQIEDNSRMEAEENLIVVQSDQKIAEAKVRRLGEDIEARDKKLVWWRDYAKGIAAIADRAKAVEAKADVLTKEASLRNVKDQATATYWGGVWGRYAELSEHVRAACAWRGAQNELAAKMCRWLHAH